LFTLLVTIAAAGCAAETPSIDDDSPTSGGKSDDGSSSGALAPLSELELERLAAVDVECFHRFSTDHDTFPAGIKLMCFDQGGAAAPIVTYLGVASPAELGPLREVYRMPFPASGDPTNVTFRMEGDQAIVSYDVRVPVDVDTLEYTTRRITSTVAFSGSHDDPQVDVRASAP
jgi:hypothetical protein